MMLKMWTITIFVCYPSFALQRCQNCPADTNNRPHYRQLTDTILFQYWGQYKFDRGSEAENPFFLSSVLSCKHCPASPFKFLWRTVSIPVISFWRAVSMHLIYAGWWQWRKRFIECIQSFYRLVILSQHLPRILKPSVKGAAGRTAKAYSAL